MKSITFLISIIFIVSAFGDEKARRLKQSGIDAFKRGSRSPLSKRLQEELQKKYFGFNKNKILTGFDGNEFYFNYLSKNGDPTQKFSTEIITDKIFRIIPMDFSPGIIPTVMVANPTLGGKADPGFTGYMEVDGNWFYVDRAREEWKATYGPALFFDLDYGKLILNQKSGGNSKVLGVNGRPLNLGKDQGGEFTTSMPRLDIVLEADSSGPYKIRKFLKVTAGLGGAASVNFAALAQVGVAVAIVPTIGGGIVSERMAPTHAKAKEMGHLSIPKKPKDFLKWQVGDRLQYDVHGGIALEAGWGFYGLSAGAQFVASGLWQKVYKKVGKTQIMARYNKNKLISFGLYAAAGPVSLSLDKFIQWENGLTFIFDIGSAKGKKMLVEFMKGQLETVQKAAINTDDLSVISGVKITGKTSGTKKDFGIGIPFLPASARWSKQKMLSESQSLYLSSKRRRNETKSGKVTAFKGKFFPIFKNSIDGFFTYVIHYPGVTDSFLGVVRSGQFAFNYENSRTSRKDLAKVLTGLKLRTGLNNFFNIKLPQSPSGLGSTEVKFAVKFKSSATQFLLGQRNQSNFERITSEFIEAYFRYYEDINAKERLCPFYKSTSRCKKSFLKDSRKAINNMKKALVIMAKNKSYIKKSREVFAKAYTEFAENMLVNPFVFQTVLNMTKGYGGDVFLSIESEKLKKFEAIMRWKKIGQEQIDKIARERKKLLARVRGKIKKKNLEKKVKEVFLEDFKRIERRTKIKARKVIKEKVVVINDLDKVIETADFKLPFLKNMDCYVKRRANGTYFLFILNYKILYIKQLGPRNAIWFVNRSEKSVGKVGGKKCFAQTCQDYGIYHSGPQVRKDLFMSNMKVELGKRPKGHIEIYSSKAGYPTIRQDIRECTNYPK